MLVKHDNQSNQLPWHFCFLKNQQLQCNTTSHSAALEPSSPVYEVLGRQETIFPRISSGRSSLLEASTIITDLSFTSSKPQAQLQVLRPVQDHRQDQWSGVQIGSPGTILSAPSFPCVPTVPLPLTGYAIQPDPSTPYWCTSRASCSPPTTLAQEKWCHGRASPRPLVWRISLRRHLGG